MIQRKTFIFAMIGLILASTVTGHKSCSRNANLMKSIKYQLKLVEDSDGKCDCEHQGNEAKKIGFLVENSKAVTNLKAGTTVIFDKVITNSGNGYDSSTGIFTAPSDGIYYFTWTVLTQSRKQFVTVLALNGNQIARNHAVANTSSDYTPASQSVVVEMKKRDEVLIKILDRHAGHFMHTDGWSTFSGFKI